MSAGPTPATIPVSVRLPASLLAQLDELCALTERQRSYWITTALEEVIPAELEETRIIGERLALERRVRRRAHRGWGGHARGA